MKITHPRIYLCCGRKTGVENPDSWLGIDIRQPCDLQMDVRKIDEVEAEIVFATPPCGGFTNLPWRRATYEHADVLKACLRLCRQAPFWLLECNRGAQVVIGQADFHRGPHYFWGNILVAEFKRLRPKSAMSGRDPLARAALPVIVGVK